eukprot:jgi/Bigna1/127449/aug1.4_g2157
MVVPRTLLCKPRWLLLHLVLAVTAQTVQHTVSKRTNLASFRGPISRTCLKKRWLVRRNAAGFPLPTRRVNRDDAEIGTMDVSHTFETQRDILAGAGIFAALLGAFRAYITSQGAKLPKYERVRMSATPIFTVTQRTGEFPYLTEVADDGTRIGYFYTEKADAEEVLKDVRANIDASARISSFPLTKVIEVIQQPEVMTGGKFRLRSSRKQMDNADTILPQLKAASAKFDRSSQVSVPVFFDSRLISVIDDEPTMMVFLKLEDMQKTWKEIIKETRKPAKKGFGNKEDRIEKNSLVNVALSTEQDTRDLKPEMMDLMSYLETVAGNKEGAKALMISSEQFIE